MRQRLSSEPDRYRGRRRVPTPPRSRYAVVGVSAFVGAGVVALGAAHNMPDAKAVNPKVLANLENASVASSQIADREADNAAASRGEETQKEMISVCPWCYETGRITALVYERDDVCSCLVHGEMPLKKVLNYRAARRQDQIQECPIPKAPALAKSA